MAKVLRRPFTGILNIVRFNWHFYVAAIGGFALYFVSRDRLGPATVIADIIATVGGIALLMSLIVSLYVYDLSDLYLLNWLRPVGIPKKIFNIHAGFDETSELLADRFPTAAVVSLDFYDPARHTEISIRRARRYRRAFEPTPAISTCTRSLPGVPADLITLILSAHEIRNENERIGFFQTMRLSLTPEGRIIVVEHLRDLSNFAAYTVGFFHFHSKRSWYRTFYKAGLSIAAEKKITPFITYFELLPNGDAS